MKPVRCLQGATGTAALTFTETVRLNELEACVERCRRSFIEAGEALREIRNAKLYRTTYGTFEDYCGGRWGFTPRYGLMLVRAAEVVERIGTIVPILPATETQARELVRLDTPELQVKAWEMVVERVGGDGSRITAKVVREEVAKLLPDEEEDDTFLPFEEAEIIRKWLTTRVMSWPEFYRPTFQTFVGGIVADIAATLESGEGRTA